MANKGLAFLLVLLLGLGGLLMTFNIPYHLLGVNLGIGFGNIHGVMSAIWILIVKAVGIALAVLCGYVCFNIIKN